MQVAETVALFSSGGFLVAGLVTGVWKYSHVAESDDGTAPTYVNVAHRSALLYSFACLVIYEFVRLSQLPGMVNRIAVVAPISFFAVAVGSYVVHGLLGDTDNQFRDPGIVHPSALRGVMWALIVTEIGGFLLLYFGAARAVI